MAAVSSPENAPIAPVPVQGAVPGRDTVGAMVAHLVGARAGSGTEALRLLRAAFPQASLADRARAADLALRAGF